MKLKVALILVLVVAGAGAVFVSMGGLTARAATTTYLTANAATADVSDDVAATGAVESTANYGLAFGSPAHLVDASASSSSGGSTATWTVKSVDVGLGAPVKKGQKLATAATTDLATDLTAAVSSRRSAAIQLEIAQDNLDNASGTDAIRQAKLGLYQAQSQLAQAETQQHDIEAQLAAATLVAPIDGIVSAINITAGADAPSGDAIVVDAGTYDVTADVVETDISKINLEPARDGDDRRDRERRRGHRRRDLALRVDELRQRQQRQRRVVRGHGHADGPAGRAEVGHDRRHHDHDRVGDERPDRARRGAERVDRQLHGPRPRGRRHAPGPAGRGRPRHQLPRRDHERPQPGRGGRHRHRAASATRRSTNGFGPAAAGRSSGPAVAAARFQGGGPGN